jgi:hypothetical protein
MLRLRGGVRLRSRTVKTLVSLGAVLALASIAVGSASATFSSPNGQNGWYVAPSVTGAVDFHPGAHQGIENVTCKLSNNTTVVGVFLGPSFGPTTTPVQVSVSGDSANPGGTVVTCTGTLLQETQACLFGGVCFYTGSFVPAGPAVEVVTLHIDNSRPVNVTAAADADPNANGWYNAPHAVIFSGSDPNSGIDFCDSGVPFGPGTAGQSIGPPDGTAKTIVGGCLNNAGLPSGPAPTVFFYNYDATAPNVSVTGVTDGAVYGSAPTPACSTSDAPSGVANDATLTLSAGPLGSVTATCSGGTDLAGNQADPVSVSYSVGTLLTTKTQAMAGDLKVAQGSTLSAGYDFTMPGQHPAATVGFLGTTVTFNATCASGTPGSKPIVVNIDDQGYNDPANSSAWYPSGNQNDASTYQGSTTVPSFCDPGALVRLQQGGTFSTYVTSTAQNKVNLRWHYMDETGGGWSGTYSVIPS